MSADGRHAADPTPDGDVKPTGPWLVVRQYNHDADETVCEHRWEWLADLCAYRHTARHAHEIGAHFTVRRAES